MMNDINVYWWLLVKGISNEETVMRVTRAQAQANREHIVETASALFRQYGYDGIGVAELMAAAGFTHGGFYKHFRSKMDLMAEAAACGFAKTSQQITAKTDMTAFVDHYASRQHRDERSSGCTLAALCSDAARQPEAVKATFAKGIECLLADLGHGIDSSKDTASTDARAATLATFATLVGSLVLSRACPDDSPLADEILAACRAKVLGAKKQADQSGESC